MNVFHRFTRESLIRNRSRTLVTIVGIILSVALLSAVTEGAYSGVQFLRRSVEQRAGSFFGYFDNLTEGEASQLTQSHEITKSTTWQDIGWAAIGSSNDYKPYLHVVSVDADFRSLVAVNLTCGRMPEKAGEILLPDHLLTNGGVSIPVGETITLDVGRRVYDGDTLDADISFAEGETLENTRPSTYTVVGTYARFDYLIEDFGCPGYTALTCTENGGSVRLFARTASAEKFPAFLAAQSAVADDYRVNSELMNCYGVTGYANINSVIYGMAGVLLFLIAFGSISLIYNSFSISVSERTRQFGILKSVGATKKQIRGSVLYEAELLCAIAIPAGLVLGCAGIGVTLYCLRDSFGFLTAGDSYTDPVQMKLVLSPIALVVSAAVGLVTALVSAWVPARRAVRIDPIRAIRQSEDIAVRGRDVRTSRLCQKFFGFEGMLAVKNFGRSRKRYRATIMGLFLSVTLFISASSFCAYLKDAVGNVADSGGAQADIYYDLKGGDAAKVQSLYDLLRSVQGVDGSVYYSESWMSTAAPAANVTADYRRVIEQTFATDQELPAGQVPFAANVLYIDDASFRGLLRANSLREEDYFNADAPLALAANTVSGTLETDGQTQWYRCAVLDESRLPVTLTDKTVLDRDGYEYSGQTREVSGETYYLYYTTEYMKTLWDSYEENHGMVYDESMALAVPESEAVVRSDYRVGAAVKESPYYVDGSMLTLLYPRSVMTAMLLNGQVDTENLPGYDASDSVKMAFTARDHAEVTRQMGSLLSEQGISRAELTDRAEQDESRRAEVTVVNVFSYGFIILISLIAMANVFNTISTSISLRRREFAMLRSVGLTQKGFRRMMDYECLIYGLRALTCGLPASFVMTLVIYLIVGQAFARSFYIPWYSVAIAVGSVFAVVFATMLYATGKIRKENTVDALKNENL